MEILETYKIDRLNLIHKRREIKRKKKIKHRICAALTVMAIGVTTFGGIYTASAKEITITEINEFEGVTNSVTVKTRKSDVSDVLNEQGITVNATDKLNMPGDTELDGDGEIVVRRGKEITVVTPESEKKVVVTSADTNTALLEAGYVTSNSDEINLDGVNIASSDTVEIKTVTTDEESEVSEIPFETVYEDSSELYSGEEKVKVEGINGELTKTYSVSRYADGTEKERILISEERSKEPVNKVILKGTKTKPTATPTEKATENKTSSASVSGNSIDGHKYSKVIEMTGTAYTDSPSENGGYTVTALGTPLRKGVVAVDPSVIPLGTKVYVVSKDCSYVYGTAVAEDTGGAIKGNRIDLCIPSAAETDAFGRRSVLVYVLDE